MTGSPHLKDGNTKQHPYSQFWESSGRGSHIWQAPTSPLERRTPAVLAALLPAVVSAVITPPGQTRKPRIREKGRQARGASQVLSAAKGKALPSSPPLPLGATVHGKPAAGSRSPGKGPWRARSTIATSAAVSRTRSSQGANCTMEKKQRSPWAPPSRVQSPRAPLSKMTGMLVLVLMQMYKMKRPARKADMMKIVGKKYKNRFLEIHQRASFSMEVVYGTDLKEVDSPHHSYMLVSKMDLPNNGRASGASRFPKTGLLMNLLGLIFMNGDCATEEAMWEFLNKMRVYAGKRHLIFGEPKTLITQGLVKLKYQVPHSDPAHYEFLWGPRAHAETSKMRVLEFFAKINHTVPRAFASWYEEALRDE
ncbi:melanoma-associated antigen B3-like, partial [Pteropus alecto]|uniref:melanoma-associated antigen B3-like n=1 Tax=Pteropus alecto TaxID=9402 RepID=UPI0003F12B69